MPTAVAASGALRVYDGVSKAGAISIYRQRSATSITHESCPFPHLHQSAFICGFKLASFSTVSDFEGKLDRCADLEISSDQSKKIDNGFSNKTPLKLNL
jgi:hypothetical protein